MFFPIVNFTLSSTEGKPLRSVGSFTERGVPAIQRRSEANTKTNTERGSTFTGTPIGGTADGGAALRDGCRDW